MQAGTLSLGTEHRGVDTEACQGFLEKDKLCRFLLEKGIVTFYGTVFRGNNRYFSKKALRCQISLETLD